MKPSVLVSKNVLLEGSYTQSDGEIAISDKDLSDVMFEFGEGFKTWYNDTQPEAFVAGYFKYDVEGVCILEVTVLGTPEECYITDIGIDWVDENGIFADFSIATYTLPNTILMEAEAEAEIVRSDYQTEAEYNYAIATWLYDEYPEYYQNPVQEHSDSTGSSDSTSSSYSYGNSFAVSDILGEIRNIDVIGSVADVWDSLGYVMKGSLPHDKRMNK